MRVPMRTATRSYAPVLTLRPVRVACRTSSTTASCAKMRRWYAAHDWDVYLDPLLVLPVEVALAESVAHVDDTFTIPVAPEGARKWFQGDGDPYFIIVPNPTADAELINDWHGDTFVAYLRSAFHWGGFPGLARAARPPLADLTYLREELLPM
jgi:hypothetical protein